jgi:hypothetical protein
MDFKDEMDNSAKSRKQPPYSLSDRKLLASLITQYDPENILTSAQRDAGTLQKKNR